MSIKSGMQQDLNTEGPGPRSVTESSSAVPEVSHVAGLEHHVCLLYDLVCLLYVCSVSSAGSHLRPGCFVEIQLMTEEGELASGRVAEVYDLTPGRQPLVGLESGMWGAVRTPTPCAHGIRARGRHRMHGRSCYVEISFLLRLETSFLLYLETHHAEHSGRVGRESSVDVQRS